MLIEKFEEQVARTPGNIAVDTGDKKFSYDRLNRYANRIAHLIRKQWPPDSKNQTVSLLFDHGVDMIAAILGTLKAGKIYVPLSLDYPDNRISYILGDSESSLLLAGPGCEERAAKLAGETGIHWLNIDDPGYDAPGENQPREAGRDKPAYIMYTSGSTGRPKGVIQSHENILYYTHNWVDICSITPDDRLSLVASFCHDQSVQDIYAGLLTGATLCPYYMKNRTGTLNIDLAEFIRARGITLWHSVPSLFSYFTGTLADDELFLPMRLILLGGEPMRQHELDMCKKHFPNARLANVYGQTESSVNAIWFLNPEEPFKKILIGTSLNKTRIFLINDRDKKAAPFESGEIMIAGPYISPGYWKNEEATKKAFSRDPRFGRLYWTGDRGRLMLDGSIEFTGRKDSQVKIRGYRIELGEIETHLLNHPLIKEAVVTIKTRDDGDSFLAAYFTGAAAPGKNPAPTELRDYLIKELPDYMIPSYFVQLEQFPLTPSGKIDRNVLPEPQMQTGQTYAAPRNKVERTLLDIWARVLGRDVPDASQPHPPIGIDDNFFLNGGDSIKSIRIVSGMRDAGYKIHMKDI
ncbi:MAG: non-ribosomal peptide synthetase, partial [bacterium]|nr:non-ribosomal peptide synthetase [bacterium]